MVFKVFEVWKVKEMSRSVHSQVVKAALWGWEKEGFWVLVIVSALLTPTQVYSFPCLPTWINRVCWLPLKSTHPHPCQLQKTELLFIVIIFLQCEQMDAHLWQIFVQFACKIFSSKCYFIGGQSGNQFTFFT